MMRTFLDSWELFQDTYVAGWLIALTLSLVGVLVIARDQIFIGAALSQASAFGVALAMWVATALGSAAEPPDSLPSLLAVASAILASLLIAWGGRKRGESHEAITGWIFLLAASASVLIVSRNPHGQEEIQRLASSSLIGATAGDAWWIGALALASLLFLAACSRRILLVTLDPTMAAAVGMRVGWWSGLLAVWLGASVGLSIRLSGMLFTFGLLVLPALIAKNLCRRIRPMFVVAPSIGVIGAVAGFVLANHYDYPPGQMTVALLGIMLFAVWGFRWSHQKFAAGRRRV